MRFVDSRGDVPEVTLRYTTLAPPTLPDAYDEAMGRSQDVPDWLDILGDVCDEE